MAAGSEVLPRLAASPTARTAIQAPKSRAVIGRPACFWNRAWSCVAPHCSNGCAQAAGTRPCVPATGRGSVVR